MRAVTSDRAREPEPPPEEPTPAPRSRRLARVAGRVLFPAAVGILGAWLAMSIGGAATRTAGPFRVRFSAQFGPGQTTISLPPIGRLSAHTHTAPLNLNATLTDVDAAKLVDFIKTGPEEATSRIASQLLRQIPWLAARLALVSLAGALILSLLVFRMRWKSVGVALLATLLVIGGSEVATYGTYTQSRLLSPKFSGSLRLAAGLIGPINTATDRISKFRGELERIVGGASRVFANIQSNPLLAADQIRVLHIGDIHLSPLGFDFALQLANSFDVDFVIDTGDLTSFGTPAENLTTSFIPEFKRPYVYVRGNHDSLRLQDVLEHTPHVKVLDGTTATVDGLRLYGVGDVFFTPDKRHLLDLDQRTDLVEQAQQRVLSDLNAMPTPPDVVLVHNDEEALTAQGLVPLVLSGHYHAESVRVLSGTLFLRVGSTGGSGAGVFSQAGGVPLTAEILYFDRATHALQGWDVVQQSPETGNVTLVRHLVEEQFGTLQPSPPSPSPSVSGSPTGSGSLSPSSPSP